MIFPGFENLKGIEPALLAKGTTCNIYRRYYNRDMKLESIIDEAWLVNTTHNAKREYVFHFTVFNKYYDDLGHIEIPITKIGNHPYEFMIRYRL